MLQCGQLRDSSTVVASGGKEETSPSENDFDHLNLPNHLEFIPNDEFKADRANLFIAFDNMRGKFRIEGRASPLLRPPPLTNGSPKPGFISFIGETGSGKSWILRSLKRRENCSRYPTPLVAPGRNPNYFASISSDVHLYADRASSESANPILFLDFEGLSGSQVPSSLTAYYGATSISAIRDSFIQDAYPRIAYAVSNCIIFVANELKKAAHVVTLLTTYSNSGVQESRHLGFKPVLFLVFNRLPIRDFSPSAWSIEDSTAAFLANPEMKDLEEHYHKIFVIKIPQLISESTNLVVAQLDELERLLREHHFEACNRRIGFRLDFTADQIIAYLTRALRVFTNRKDALFDGPEQSSDHELPYSTKTAEEKWIQFLRHFSDSGRLSPVKAFQAALEAFYSHFIFCVRLHLARHPLVGRTVGYIPCVLEDVIRDIDKAISGYVPCGSTKHGLECDGIRLRHDVDFHICGAKRWKGGFEHTLQYDSLKDRVSDSLIMASGSVERLKLSIKDWERSAVLSTIRSVYSCAGCLSHPSTVLSCEHAFCEDCVEDIVCGKDLHRLDTVKCPYCQDTSKEQHFSPRFLPHTAGYRILSLDGGGVRGIAQIKILREIEKRCFEIPIVYLFDFLIGTSIGGQLILALASREPPLILSNAEMVFRDLIAKSFKPKQLFDSTIWRRWIPFVTGSTKYKASAFDGQLKDFFQESPRLLSAHNPPSPHVAVTAASHASFQTRLIPNYMRRPSVDSDEKKRRLVLSPEPKDCMPTWVAARCTAAAYPYFKGFEWKGEYLLDGGFVVNCPAGLAVEEARLIWPNRRMDTLVSIGTGVSTIASHAHHKEDLLKIDETTVQLVVSSERSWTEFQTRHRSKERIFRLQPTYGEIFPLDAVNKLDFISQDVERWLTTQKDQIDHTSNQLIASLFFFKPSALDSESGTRSGTIECRLPPGFSARQAMVNALIKVSRARELFTVNIPGQDSSGEPIHGALPFLEDLSPDEELLFPVTFEHLPIIGPSTIDIKLCDIFGNGEARYSISGCPFTIRE